jgi:hypothetical protein
MDTAGMKKMVVVVVAAAAVVVVVAVAVYSKWPRHSAPTEGRWVGEEASSHCAEECWCLDAAEAEETESKEDWTMAEVVACTVVVAAVVGAKSAQRWPRHGAGRAGSWLAALDWRSDSRSVVGASEIFGMSKGVSAWSLTWLKRREG